MKQAEIFRVRELVKKIESHPHREALQRDLQQNNAYNPFSEKSKKMMKDMGNVGLFENVRDRPKSNAKSAYYIGVKVSSIALASISRKKVKPAEAPFNVHWKTTEQSFVHLNSNMIELKRSVSRWTSLRKKISPIIWRKQNTFDTERIGGSLSIIPEHLDH